MVTSILSEGSADASVKRQNSADVKNSRKVMKSSEAE